MKEVGFWILEKDSLFGAEEGPQVSQPGSCMFMTGYFP